MGNLKARLDENNDDAGKRLKLIRIAHNVKEKVVEHHTERVEDSLYFFYYYQQP
ncbi:MAG: hypothetical protein WA364_21690 [Candidatus Nitrosopolaris sp.]